MVWDEDNVGGYWIVNDAKNIVGVCVSNHLLTLVESLLQCHPKAVQCLVDDIVKSKYTFIRNRWRSICSSKFSQENGQKRNKRPVIPFLGLRLYKLECVKTFNH